MEKRNGGGRERVREPVIVPKKVSPVPKRALPPVSRPPVSRPPISPIPPKPKPVVIPTAHPSPFWRPYVKPYVPGPNTPGFEYGGKLPAEDTDVAIKAARVAAIKATSLSNKTYNVGGSTSPATGTPASGIIFGGGGGGGGYSYGTEPEGGTFFSNIPSIVWVILAFAGGWFLIQSSGQKGSFFKGF